MSATINPLDLSGRRILITGASSGIGRETAVLLSQLGAKLVLSGRNEQQLSQTASLLEGSDHESAPFDIGQLDSIPSWIKTVCASGGALSGIVHSAGVHKAIPLRMLAPATIDEVMRINVTSGMMLARGFRQKGCHAENSSFVVLSSVAGIVGEGGVSAYSASKAALIGLVRSLAVELAPDRIRVNALAPGFVESEMGDRLKQALTPEQLAAITNKHLIGLGSVRDVAHGVAFLLADTGRWITGTTIVMDGGYSIH